MKRFGLLIAGALGGLTALILAVLSELVRSLVGLPDIAFSFFDWMARHMPGPLISLFIGTMVKVISALQLGPTATVAKGIEQGTAIVVFMAIGVVFGILLAASARHSPAQLANYGLWGSVFLMIVWIAIFISLSAQTTNILIGVLWFGFLFMGWGWTLGKLIENLAWPAGNTGYDPSRRKFLYLVGAGAFTVLVSAAGISLVSEKRSIPNTGNTDSNGSDSLANTTKTSGPAKSPDPAALEKRFKPVPGTRPEITDNANFYRIDINTIPPSIDAATWQLDVKGMVNQTHQYTLDELRSRPSVSQVVTLECISNEVGGDLTSTSLWTGVRLRDILAEAGIKPGAQAIYMTAEDGFYESISLTEAMDDRTLLVYQMNGQPLPVEHGFPLRIYIPNHFGMKQPKWLTSLEVIDHQGTGYWVDRGWNNQAIPPTTSVIDTVDTDDFDPKTGVVPVGGIAYAGARGISKVEVQVDQGPWLPAELRTPPLSPLTWVQWRYFWKAQIGQHTFRVRAYDGTGQLQIETPAPPEPDGATGLYAKSAFVPQGENNSQK